MARLLALACVVTAFLAASVASASAARDAPPGNAGQQQYTESLPEAGGTRPTRELSAGGHGGDSRSGGDGGASSAGEAPASPAEALGAKTAHRFDKAGSDGRAAARLAAAAAAAPKKASGAGGAASGASRFGQVVGQLTGTDSSQGMGLLLPLIIVATLALAVGYLFARRRPARTRS